MKFILDDKEVSLEELKKAIDNLFIGNEDDGYSETIELESIDSDTLYFNTSSTSYYGF